MIVDARSARPSSLSGLVGSFIVTVRVSSPVHCGRRLAPLIFSRIFLYFLGAQSAARRRQARPVTQEGEPHDQHLIVLEITIQSACPPFSFS